MAVLQQHRVTLGPRDLHIVDLQTAGLRDTEDPSAAAVGDDLAHPDVGGVLPVDHAIAVGRTEGGVAGPGRRVVPHHGLDIRIDGVIEQQAGMTGAHRRHGAHGEPVHAVGLHPVGLGAGDVDLIDADVPGLPYGVIVTAVQAHAVAALEPQVDLAEVHVRRGPQVYAEVRGPGDVQVRHSDVFGVADRERTHVLLVAELILIAGHMDGAADLERGVALQLHGDVGRHRAGTAHHHRLLLSAALTEAVRCGLHGPMHGIALEDRFPAVGRGPDSTVTLHLGVVLTLTALRVNLPVLHRRGGPRSIQCL